jgi:hypothetical protein
MAARLSVLQPIAAPPPPSKKRPAVQLIATGPSRKRTAATVEIPFFPYPYSGVQFAYSVPLGDEVLHFLNDTDSKRNAVSYLGKLQDRFKNELRYAYVYPSSDEGNKNFLDWLKVVQYIRHTPEMARQYKSITDTLPFLNFHPGNPHMQYQWLINMDPSKDLDFVEPIIDTDNQPVYVKNSKWKSENMYPIDDEKNYIVLQYLTRKDIGERKEEETASFFYCGDIQLAWELAAQKLQNGNFKKCKMQFEKLPRFRPIVGELKREKKFTLDETLEDIIELMTTEPIAITTLKREIDSMNWLIGSRTAEIKKLQEIMRNAEEARIPESKKKEVEASFNTLGRVIESQKEELKGIVRKRRAIETEITGLQEENVVREKRARISDTIARLNLNLPPESRLSVLPAPISAPTAAPIGAALALTYLGGPTSSYDYYY